MEREGLPQPYHGEQRDDRVQQLHLVRVRVRGRVRAGAGVSVRVGVGVGAGVSVRVGVGVGVGVRVRARVKVRVGVRRQLHHHEDALGLPCLSKARLTRVSSRVDLPGGLLRP